MAKKRQMEVVRDTWKPLLESETLQTHSVAPAGKKKKWIHENKELLFGSVTYKVKHLGTVEVDSCDGKETIQKAIHDLRQKGTSKLPEVEISISVRSIIITEVKSKMHICKHKLQKIAYCSDDKVTGVSDKIFAFIVKKSESLFQCYCFETQSAHRITLTVGQAFQLAWERFQEAKGASESFVVEMKRIKAKRGKEDFVKKLAEIHQSPSFEEDDEDDVVPELNHPRMGRRSSMGRNLTALDEHWQQLNDTMRILRDDDAPFPQQTELISDFDKAFASIQQEIEEWNTAKSPFQSNWDVEDALQELDSALNPLGSSSSTLLTDSQTTLPQLSSPEMTAL